MGNDASKVAAGKPKVGGSIYCAPVGTALPTDASTALAEAYKCLGYVSEEGLKNNLDRSRQEIKAWGGDTVMLLDNSVDDTFKYMLIECLNVEVLKHVYGSDNVTEDNGKISVDVTDMPAAEEHVLVIETILKDHLKRIILPRAAVKEVAEIEYVDDDVIGYDTTVTCMPVVLSGKKVYHRELIEEAS